MMKRFGLAVTHCQKDAHDEQLLDPPPLLLPMHKRLDVHCGCLDAHLIRIQCAVCPEEREASGGADNREGVGSGAMTRINRLG